MVGELLVCVLQAAQRALVVMREKAANEAKSEFMSLMCHEVRTPLNGCLASAGARPFPTPALFPPSICPPISTTPPRSVTPCMLASEFVISLVGQSPAGIGPLLAFQEHCTWS